MSRIFVDSDHLKLLILAVENNIVLIEQYSRTIEYNSMRPHMHGGKKF